MAALIFPKFLYFQTLTCRVSCSPIPNFIFLCLSHPLRLIFYAWKCPIDRPRFMLLRLLLKNKTYLIHLNKFLMWLLTGNNFFLENQKVGWTSTSFLLLYKWPWYTRNWVYFTIFIRTLCPTLHLWLGDLKSIPKLVERFFFFALEFFGEWWRSETKNILHFFKKWFEILIFLNNFFVEITFTWK